VIQPTRAQSAAELPASEQPLGAIQTFVQPSGKKNYWRVGVATVSDVWEQQGKSGAKWICFHCLDLMDEDKLPSTFAIDKAGWLAQNRVVPAKGCRYWIEASRSAHGFWWFCRRVILIVPKPTEKTVPVPEMKTHHVENVPSTQRTAFELLKAKLPEKRFQVLKVIAEKGLEGTNLQDMEEPMHAPKNTFSGRVSELLRDGYIVDTGKRVLRHGEWFRVVAATQQSIAAFTQPEGN